MTPRQPSGEIPWAKSEKVPAVEPPRRRRWWEIQAPWMGRGGGDGHVRDLDRDGRVEDKIPAAESIKVGCFGLHERGAVLLARATGILARLVGGVLLLRFLGRAAGRAACGPIAALAGTQQFADGTTADRVGHKNGQQHRHHPAHHRHFSMMAGSGAYSNQFALELHFARSEASPRYDLAGESTDHGVTSGILFRR